MRRGSFCEAVTTSIAFYMVDLEGLDLAFS
jgi:hypothetical protein